MPLMALNRHISTIVRIFYYYFVATHGYYASITILPFEKCTGNITNLSWNCFIIG
jgi:hypothetical protein